MLHPHTRGFTLIELLVVISIISLLASILLVTLNGARTQATDSVRVQNVETIQKALYIYMVDHPTLPTCSDSGYAGGCMTVSVNGHSGYVDSSQDGTFVEFLRPLIGNIGHADNTSVYYYANNGEWPLGSGNVYKYFIGTILDNPNNPVLKQSLNFGTPGLENYYVIGEK